MGTRSLTEIVDGSTVLLTMYRQYNGYLTGHGAELKDAFGQTKLVNGLGSEQNVANGMGCLAAQVIKHFKDGPGGIYIEPPGTRDCGEEYVYIISNRKNALWLTIYEGGVTFFGFSQKDAGLDEQRPEAAKPIYSGPISEFDPEKIEQTYHAA